jgi:F420-non-reducing hydrogenase iron-sulfur subunit
LGVVPLRLRRTASAPRRAALARLEDRALGDGFRIRSLQNGTAPEPRTSCLKKGEGNMSEKFEPVILGFLCNWCAYAGGDLAGVSRLQYPPNMRAVRVMCSGMVHPELAVEAFRRGADGVILMG